MKLDNELQHRIFAGTEFHNLAPQYAKLCLLLSVRTVGRRRTMILSGINRELRLVCGIAVNSVCRAGIWFRISILNNVIALVSWNSRRSGSIYQGDSIAIHCQLTGTSLQQRLDSASSLARSDDEQKMYNWIHIRNVGIYRCEATLWVYFHLIFHYTDAWRKAFLDLKIG